MKLRRTLRNEIDFLVTAAHRLDGELVIAPPIPGGEQWAASILTGPAYGTRSIVGRGATGRAALSALYDELDRLAA